MGGGSAGVRAYFIHNHVAGLAGWLAWLARAILCDCQQPYLSRLADGELTQLGALRVIRLSGDKEISYYLVRRALHAAWT
jgi:hypothetical protein